MTEAKVVERINQAIKRTSLSDVAREMGVAFSNLHAVASGKQAPGKKILKHMGIVRVVSYKLEAR